MNHTAQKANHKRRSRSRMGHPFFAPSFHTIINDIMNSPLNEVVSETPMKYSHPLVNIIKGETSYTIAMAIPGVEKEDVKINVEKNKLTITSKKETKDELKYRLREFNYAQFERAFTLSEDADIDNISAKYNNGLLELTIPRIAPEGPKKVEIV